MSMMNNESWSQTVEIRKEASSLYEKHVEHKKNYEEGKIKKESYMKYMRGLNKKADAFSEKYGYKKEYIDLISSVIARMNS